MQNKSVLFQNMYFVSSMYFCLYIECIIIRHRRERMNKEQYPKFGYSYICAYALVALWGGAFCRILGLSALGRVNCPAPGPPFPPLGFWKKRDILSIAYGFFHVMKAWSKSVLRRGLQIKRENCYLLHSKSLV